MLYGCYKRSFCRFLCLMGIVGTLLFGQAACGGGSTVYLGGSGEHGGTGSGDSGNENNGETSGVFGATTVTSTSEHYEMIISIGEAAPIGNIESDSGVYEIQSPLTF